MKIRSLLLGSVAVAGLTGAASAADLGVLPSFDVCDDLGLSGLTISSDENCLAITGGVTYSFEWGDYAELGGFGGVDVEVMGGDPITTIEEDGLYDWNSKVEAWLTFVGTAASDMGPAMAVITLTATDQTLVEASATTTDDDDTDGVVLDEAYVQIGDSSSFTLIAGMTDSIFDDGDDEPLNFLGLFNSEAVDTGVGSGGVDIATGGHVLQALVSLGDGFTIGGGLEALDNTDVGDAGTLVGVVSYSGDGISAHASIAGNSVLSGDAFDEWMIHAGFDGTFDNFRVVAAGYYDSTDYWNVLASASMAFDIFTLAVSGEAVSDGTFTDYGYGVSIAAEVVDDIVLTLGGRYYYNDFWGTDSYEVAAQIAAPVTETLSATGTIGYITDDFDDVIYGSAELVWAPTGSGFSATSGLEVTSEGAYKVSTELTKEFM